MIRTCQRLRKVKDLRKCSGMIRSRSLADKADDSDNDYVPPGGQYVNPLKTLKKEIRGFGKLNVESLESPVPRYTDILIIGGGIVGSATAFFLKSKSPQGLDVTVVERDHCYTRASTMLSVGGLRHQFTQPENVQMSLYMTEFLRNVKEHLSVLGEDPPEVAFHHQGYLFLAPEDGAEKLRELVNMQREVGAKTEFLTKGQLESRFPWLNVEGIDCGSYGVEGEGYFDPWQLVRALRRKNINLGVNYVDGEVTKFRFVKTYAAQSDDSLMEKQNLDGVDVRHANGRMYGCNFSSCINAAGPWAGEIAKMAGIGTGEDELSLPLPVEPRKRFVYVFHCPNGPMATSALTVDPSGAYYRREGLGGYYVCGASPLTEEEEPDPSNLEVDYDFYQNFVWPAISYRVPAFENSKLKSAWAGYYDYNTVDQNLIIGPHSYYNRMCFANGMSGHGVQQGVAIGRAISELIYYGEYKTIDLTRYGFDRFLVDEPLVEQAIV